MRPTKCCLCCMMFICFINEWTLGLLIFPSLLNTPMWSIWLVWCPWEFWKTDKCAQTMSPSFPMICCQGETLFQGIQKGWALGLTLHAGDQPVSSGLWVFWVSGPSSFTGVDLWLAFTSSVVTGCLPLHGLTCEKTKSILVKEADLYTDKVLT